MESAHSEEKAVGEEMPLSACLSLALHLSLCLSLSLRWVESEGLLDRTRPLLLWCEYDNEVYRREDYTILTLPLV